MKVKSLDTVNKDNVNRDKVAFSSIKRARNTVNNRVGIVIPMYLYPDDIFNNDDYNKVIDAVRVNSNIDFHIILNPSNGSGGIEDLNYTRAIRRLQGAGAYVYGYVATGYSYTAYEVVVNDIDEWLKYYPTVDGIFFDEMSNSDTSADRDLYKSYKEYTHNKGIELSIGNPGTTTPTSYFEDGVMDYICTHETDTYPDDDKYTGDWADSFMEFQKSQRIGLVYAQSEYSDYEIEKMAKWHSLVYVTDDDLDNPWDSLSIHFDSLVKTINRLSNGVEVDANTLNNIDSTQFVRSDEDDVLSGKYLFTNGGDVSPTSEGAITIGDLSALNISFDNNEIMARNDGEVYTLNLNREGGSVIINDLAINFDFSHESRGYQKLPSGTIIQWGTEDSTDTTIYYPIAFPNAYLTASANQSDGDESKYENIVITNGDANSFYPDMGDKNEPFTWIAIGY